MKQDSLAVCQTSAAFSCTAREQNILLQALEDQFWLFVWPVLCALFCETGPTKLVLNISLTDSQNRDACLTNEIAEVRVTLISFHETLMIRNSIKTLARRVNCT